MHAHSSASESSAPPSLLQTLDLVKRQVEFYAFAHLKWRYTDPLYNELCLIMSEVLVMDPDSALKVNGATIKTSLVQEVFTQLRHDHLRLVFENFQYITYKVYNKKAYLRTALYNSLFEIESHYAGLGFD
jgi:hypothetical protein